MTSAIRTCHRGDGIGHQPASELARAARGRIRAALYGGAQAIPRRREGGGPPHLPARGRVVPRARPDADRARKSVVSGKGVSVRVDLGGARISKKKNKKDS